eukprot:5761959-Pleurochrysis_carterae.AAC.1
MRLTCSASIRDASRLALSSSGVCASLHVQRAAGGKETSSPASGSAEPVAGPRRHWRDSPMTCPSAS